MKSFSIAAVPALTFGEGKLLNLPPMVRCYGQRALIVTGQKSFMASSHTDRLWAAFKNSGIAVHHHTIAGEPSPDMIDQCVGLYKDKSLQVVVAIGGGAVLDAGKAIAAMLTVDGSVTRYLEGVGDLTHPGSTLPFLAVPTTAGTGSEATKNAVLSEVGANGYKRSLRHDNFVPKHALLDPELSYTCPPSVTAASGMDAFTQLLESFVSTKANPFTDALARQGLHLIIRSLLRTYQHEEKEGRSDLMLAAYHSGITLANAGLGLVHGFASSIGGLFPIAHGVICSRLMGPCNRVTVRQLRKESSVYLSRYEEVGRMLPGHETKSEEYVIDKLLDYIDALTQQLKIPSLDKEGIASEDFERIIALTDNKNNPVTINKEGMLEILEMACT